MRVFGLIVNIMVVLSSLFGNGEGTRRALRGFITFMAVIYGIRILLYTGFAILPVIIIIWAISNVAVPFLRGFAYSFRKER